MQHRLINRLSRLARRVVGVYSESGSISGALGFLAKVLAAKASAAALHTKARLLYYIGRHPVVDVRGPEASKREGPLVVAIAVSGGLGDLIVIARCVRDLAANVEPFTFDVFAPNPELARWVFSSIPGFQQVAPDTLLEIVSHEYDMRLHLNQVAYLHYESLNWARLRNFPRFLQVINNLSCSRRRQKLDLYIENHPFLDNGLARKIIYAGFSRRDFMHSMFALKYGGDYLLIEQDENILQRLGLMGRTFVTVHNGFDSNFIISGQRATKCYPHFSAVVAGLKAAHPDILLVQIGTTTSVKIPGVDLNLIGQTSLREVAGILGASTLHIDNEGGLVHLSACYGRRSLVVFGPTPVDYFGYPQNINVNPERCGGCWWIDEHWMDRCPRGIEEVECMYSQPPEKLVQLACAAIAQDLELIPGSTVSYGELRSKGEVV